MSKDVDFYNLKFTENQRKIIEQVISELTEQRIFDAPLVTEVNAEMPFYTAEKEHNNYFNNKVRKYDLGLKKFDLF